jgi:hypothetical protein
VVRERTIQKSLAFRQIFIQRENPTPFCAADISVVNRGPSARTCLSYALFQFSFEGKSEFSRRTGLFKSVTTEISATKKQKQKAARRVRLFWLLFWRSKKVTCRRQPRQCYSMLRITRSRTIGI